jgi:hypothetical protein
VTIPVIVISLFMVFSAAVKFLSLKKASVVDSKNEQVELDVQK